MFLFPLLTRRPVVVVFLLVFIPPPSSRQHTRDHNPIQCKNLLRRVARTRLSVRYIPYIILYNIYIFIYLYLSPPPPRVPPTPRRCNTWQENTVHDGVDYVLILSHPSSEFVLGLGIFIPRFFFTFFVFSLLYLHTPRSHIAYTIPIYVYTSRSPP